MGETLTYRVPGMHCSHCEDAVKEEVSIVEGVESVDVDLDSKLVTVRGRELPTKAPRRHRGSGIRSGVTTTAEVAPSRPALPRGDDVRLVRGSDRAEVEQARRCGGVGQLRDRAGLGQLRPRSCSRRRPAADRRGGRLPGKPRGASRCRGLGRPRPAHALAAAAALTAPLVVLAMVSLLQFDGWQWFAFAPRHPSLWAADFHAAALANARHRAATMDTLISIGTLAAWGWSVVALLALDDDTYFEVAAGHHDADPARPLSRGAGEAPFECRDSRAARARREGCSSAPRRTGGRRPDRRPRAR